eukprot:2556374-Karenia_brevis.AAC.1
MRVQFATPEKGPWSVPVAQNRSWCVDPAACSDMWRDVTRNIGPMNRRKYLNDFLVSRTILSTMLWKSSEQTGRNCPEKQRTR